MRFISERRLIRKDYVIIFISGILLFIAGFVITTIANLIPSVGYGNPGYSDYVNLMNTLSSVSTLVQNIGIVFFSVATFLGALTDESLSTEVRRALVIASGIGIVALVIFNRLIIYTGFF